MMLPSVSTRLSKYAWIWLLLVLAQPALAQHEFDAWRFGINAGLQFGQVPTVAPPMPVAGSALNSYEACASAADSTGRLTCYTDGQRVWNRLNQLMPNGRLAGGNISAAQGALLLPDPGASARYYLFSVDAVENALAAGLRYSVVDMRLNNGLGDVLTPHSQRLAPVPDFRCTEGLTAVCDRSQTGYWILVHGVNTADFYAYHLQANGLAAAPVLSTVGSIHTNNYPTRAPAANSLLRAAPNGLTLAAGVPGQGFELFNFDNATGRVSNPRQLPLGFVVPYGVEFSDDNSKVYLSDISRGTLYQYDLAAPAGPMVLIANQGDGNLGGLQRGPDGRIYVARASEYALGVILNPNRPGVSCTYQPASVALGTARAYLGLPNFPNALLQNRRGPQLLGPTAACAGNLLTFGASPAPATATAATWDFGEPAAGLANVAQGSPVQHRYAGPGTYQVRLTLSTDSATWTLVRAVTVEPAVTLQLWPADTLLCPGAALRLRLTGYLPGSAFVWSDIGAAQPERRIASAGQYAVRVTSPAGCETMATAIVRVTACSAPGILIPNIITPNGDNQNQTFVLKGLHAPDWSLRIFSRWGQEVFRQEQYDNAWAAQGQPDGTYYYQLINRTSNQRMKGWLEVRR